MTQAPSPNKQFEEEKLANITKMGDDAKFRKVSSDWMDESITHKYSYNFSWLGRPIIQYPEDIVALQEIIWETKPDLIFETGIAHGGSLIFHASMLELLGGDRKVLGVDIDIRHHNRQEIESHPMFKRIQLLEGSSVDKSVIEKVKEIAAGYKSVMVILDSLHTHQHVLDELIGYAPLVKKGGYLVVLDTVIEFTADNLWQNRPWGHGDNPFTAVQEFLKTNKRFEIDNVIDNKLALSVGPKGYLKCIAD